MTNQSERTICPYLGLNRDRNAVAAAPTELHVCYLCQPLRVPPKKHQVDFCLSSQHSACQIYKPDATAKSQPAQIITQRRRRSTERRQASIVILALFLITALLFSFTVYLQLPSTNIRQSWLDPVAPATATPLQVLISADESQGQFPGSAGTETPTATSVNQLEEVAPVTTDRFFTPTPVPGGQVMTITPQRGESGWWLEDARERYINDSFLYAGSFAGKSYIMALRFDLSRVPRGAPITQATLRLTGLQDFRLPADAKGGWLVQLLAESAVDSLAGADFLTIYSAPASITLLPELQRPDLATGRANSWTLDASVNRWIEQQRLDGATSIYVRVLASGQEGDALFAWDSGYGAGSAGNAPMLVLSLEAPPPSPPPLPTRQVVVATLTPVPENVMTVVALESTATAEALAIGTRTPLAYQVVTPTPFPQNLETVQAAANIMGLPPVLMHTPVPQNAATATSIAEYATAVALTTGTFTPVPAAYVTPILILPSPPPENVATAAARVLAATAVAASGAATPTPLPYNAVIADYVYATPIPESAEAALALIQETNARAATTGTPTPLPWYAVVITRVPSPMPPTPTPIPLIVPEELLTPTPTPTATVEAPTELPDSLRNKIIFQSDRGGGTQTYAMDPVTGENFLITQDWVHPLAAQQLPLSPDGRQRAIVKEAGKDYQIYIYSLEYGDQRRLPTFSHEGRAIMNYDPAWSPLGDLIAFVSNHTGNDEVYIVDTEGRITQQLTHNGWEWDKHPSWSPDGRQIVFLSNRESGRKQIWIMNADGSDQRNLSNNPYNDWDPVWTR